MSNIKSYKFPNQDDYNKLEVEFQKQIDELYEIIKKINFEDLNSINDAITSLKTTWSSTKINDLIKKLQDKFGKDIDNLKEDMEKVKSTVTVDTYEDIANLEDVQEGTIIYVKSDSNSDGSNVYVVESITSANKVDVCTPISDFVKSTVPKLSYDASMPEGTKIYKSNSDDVIIRFKFTSDTYGDGKYKIYRDGVLLKSFSDAKGNVLVNLGKFVNDGTFEITVTATDYLGIPAPETLKFTAIVGGLKLKSSFDETLQTAIYEIGDTISFPYEVSVSDKTAIIKMDFKLYYGDQVYEETVNTNASSDSGVWTTNNTPIRGKYKLEVQAYTGESVTDETEGTFISSKLSYVFNVLAENEIAILSDLSSTDFDTNTYVSIPFKVTSKIANYFLVRGTIYVNNSGSWEEYKTTSAAGLQTQVNSTSYWSIGKLPEGNYKYVLYAYTLDETIQCLEPAIVEIAVKYAEYNRVQPVMANLIAWFDANEKRNTDEDNNIWYNNSKLGDTYRVELHELNYVSNGWKHVDPSLSDEEDGEYMLKFTGDSYGELVKVERNGSTTRYNPFSIFENSGTQGIAIETAIRSRCVGDYKAKVLTCMNGTTTDTPGVSISYDNFYLASDSQVNSFNHMEDEWAHVCFVVDKNIRTMQDVGKENIENFNPVYTTRIYINGVLCSCTSFKTDNFLDASGKSFPLLLNACLVDNKLTNFGECEIKFLRIYNSYLTSADVLNNYISHIYDRTEQQNALDRNDLNKRTLPTIVFKRNLASNNKSTFSMLHTVTDKKQQKKVFVDCDMEYDDGKGNITVINNVDVYTQGTSSLQYPIKNYKIKAYADAEHKTKFKFTPPGMEEEWKPDYVYTLKCD